MKQIIYALALAVIMLCSTSVTAEELNKGSLTRLSHLLKKGSAAGIKLPDAEKKEVEQLLLNVLPDNNYIGRNKEWKVTYHDVKDGDFFQADLKNKGDKSFDKYIWFHILYKQEKPSFYGSEDFEGYRGMGMKDAHYFILVGNVEIRAVASSEQYKSDSKIRDMLRAFKLKEIEKL